MHRLASKDAFRNGSFVASPPTQSMMGESPFRGSSAHPINGGRREKSRATARWPRSARIVACRPGPPPRSRTREPRGKESMNDRTSGQGTRRRAAYDSAMRSYVVRISAFVRAIRVQTRRREDKDSLVQTSREARPVSRRARPRNAPRGGQSAATPTLAKDLGYTGALLGRRT